MSLSNWQLFFQDLERTTHDDPLQDNEVLSLVRQVHDTDTWTEQGALAYRQVILDRNPVAYYRLDEVAGGATYRGTVIADGPSSYWRLDETSGNALDIVGSNNGTVNGTVTRGVTGALADGDTAMTFDGSTGWISAAAAGTFNFTGTSSFTIECWVKVSSLPGAGLFPRIVHKVANDGAGKNGWLVSIGASDDPNPGKILFERWVSGTQYQALSNVALTTGVWHHVVCVYNGTTMTVYLDGTAGTGVSSTASLLSSSSVVAFARRGDAAAAFLAGSLDEIAIYPSVLTGTQVSNHYSLRTATTTATAFDSTANDFDGTYNGGITLQVAGAIGDGNKAASFDKVFGTKITTPNGVAAAMTGLSACTLEAWINPSTLSSADNYSMVLSWTGNLSAHFGMTGTGGVLTRFEVVLDIGGIQRTTLSGTGIVAINTWFHLVGVYDGSSLALYINGAFNNSNAYSGALNFGSPSSMWIGGYNTAGTYGFGGTIDEVAVYSYALTAAQILENYTAGSYNRKYANVTAVESRVGIARVGYSEVA